MKLTRYEHSAFVLEADGQKLGFDLGHFTSTNTLRSLLPLHAMFVSHGHGDHYSEANVRAAGVPVGAPSDVVSVLPPGIETYTLHIGLTVLLAGFAITPTPANHGPKLTRPIENYGFIIERAGRRIYFVGDMAIATPPPDGYFDLILVPVDGGGFVFDPQQAVAFMRMMSHRGMVVPIHDGDPAEPGCVERFVDLAEGVFKAVVLKPGESVEV
jgi:L-ascorbate metabolism protein UlaG (beta-lactamase superfamily)